MGMCKSETLETIDRVLPDLGLAETRVFNYILQEAAKPDKRSNYISLDRFCFCTKFTEQAVITAIHRLLERGLITKTKHPGIRTLKYSVTANAAQLTKSEPYQEPELP